MNQNEISLTFELLLNLNRPAFNYKEVFIRAGYNNC